MSQNRKILVTGHAGFIGSHLARKLLNLGFIVAGVDNYNDYYDPKYKVKNAASFLANPNFSEHRIDILDQKKLKQVFDKQKFDGVIHLAARAGVRPSLENPQLYRDVNVTGTKNLIDLAKKFKVKQFIFASSSLPSLNSG